MPSARLSAEGWRRKAGVKCKVFLRLACVASGTGIAIIPESVLDTVQCALVKKHELPKVLANVVTPLGWRTGEQIAAVVALRDLAEKNAPMRPSRQATR